ncbi:hypothetical protein GDO81_001826, partial [Engystomops pustulosus]
MEIANRTMGQSFILIGFPGGPIHHYLMFSALLLIFVITLAGNILIIFIITTDPLLHTPMYFFLVNMSFLETCGISSIIPKLLCILIGGKKLISASECYLQTIIYFFITSSVFLILAVMSFDRYVAICHPLRYVTIMRHIICVCLLCLCMVIAFICLMYPIIMISKLPYCGSIINHFFCDIAAVLKLICVEISFIKLSILISSVFILVIPLILTVYVYKILIIPSAKGRHKTFSTCVSHLTMVSIVFGSAIFIQIRPPKDYSTETDKVVNLVSTILAPLLNPFIYTLRNQQVKKSI